MYRRFLNNTDYLGLVTEEALAQLTRNVDRRMEQAEEMAEESIVEYLSDGYEIEAVLEAGKNLLPYNRQITYPAGSHFYYNGEIYRATRSINGRKAPQPQPYWVELETYNVDEAQQYTQRNSYVPGDIVKFVGVAYKCLNYNGPDYNDIRIPGVDVWTPVETTEWVVNQLYNEWDVVSYNGRFYALLTAVGCDWNTNPHDSDNWGLVGLYDAEYNAYELSDHEVVEYDGKVYCPTFNPNADELKEGYNIVKDDPRHSNVKKHLLRLAVYELHKLISPGNVSSSRVADYETSIMWLRDAARFKINPQLPRKVAEDNKPSVGYAVATYMRDYDPYKNPWQI